MVSQWVLTGRLCTYRPAKRTAVETSSAVPGKAMSLALALKMAEKRFEASVNSEELASMMSPLKPAFLRLSASTTIVIDFETVKGVNKDTDTVIKTTPPVVSCFYYITLC